MNITKFQVQGLPLHFSPHLFIIDDIIDAVAGIGSAGINAASQAAANENNLQIARETNQANRELYSQQFRDQIRMWNMQNAYNTPTAEVNRLRSAGINPALSFGDSAQASAMSAPQPHPAVGATVEPVFHNTENVLAAVGDFAKNMADARVSQKNSDWIDAEKRTQIQQTLATIAKLKEDAHTSIAQRKQLEAAEHQTRLESFLLDMSMDDRLKALHMNAQQMDLQNQVLKEQKVQVQVDSALKEAQRLFQIDENSRQNTLLKSAIAESIARINLLASQRNLAIWQAADVFHTAVSKIIGYKQSVELFNYLKQGHILDNDGKYIRNILAPAQFGLNIFNSLKPIGANMMDALMFLK